MRTDPKLRSLVSPEMLDNMFGWALSEVPFTLANIQVQRGGIATWITAYGADDEAMAGAGSLVSVIGAIERRLRVVSPGADRKEINGLVGKILAGAIFRTATPTLKKRGRRSGTPLWYRLTKGSARRSLMKKWMKRERYLFCNMF
jgi:hypothetical protein